jgi:uncharacterized protein
MTGRQQQTAQMQDTLHASKPAFVAVTGRRRVGKTYLIEQVYASHFCFKATGIQGADTKTQAATLFKK